MKTQFVVLLVVGVAVAATSAAAQQRRPTVAAGTQQKTPKPSPTETNIEKRLEALESTSNETSRHLSQIEIFGDRIEKRLLAINQTLAGSQWSSIISTLLPSIIAAAAALLGLYVGGIANDRLQQKRLAQEMELANARAAQDRELAATNARLQIGGAVVQWELQQLSLLYGPIRALLGQSFALYRQMNQVLEEADGSRFRFVQKDQDVDGRVFEILVSGKWERFRTVMHLSDIYGKGLGVETYFDEIISIGKRIVGIIEKHAGYVRPDQPELMVMFAKYLAHFAVLKNLHDAAKRRVTGTQEAGATTQNMKVDLSAAFPQELHGLINKGFEAITSDIQEWRKKAIA